ncbi:hypothetical protein GCM10022234_02720 [Aeromicrobium panaciterrae]|uniref:type IV toxin-antitoxin system AbiEi family antitoxin domain-containing protein n=1 Tax=Aeromicrobium panaciterrae TaxID=363861 RepID=UPI0031DD7AB5
MDQYLTETAEANGGYLMRHQLIDLGLSDAQIRSGMQSKVLRRIRHGTYAMAHEWTAMTATERHCVLVRSVLDKLGDRVVASHHSASALYGHDLFGVDLDTVHVTRIDGGTSRREAGIAFHHGAVVPTRDIREIDGRLVVEPMRAVFETCSHVSIESGMVLATSALRSEQITVEELIEARSQFAHWMGTRKARIAIRLADARLESVGEVRSLHMMWRHRLPHPELQHQICDVRGQIIARTDFAWLDHRHTGEFDGLMKYGRLNPYNQDPGQAIEDEKIREDRVRDESYGMTRWVWASLAPSQQAKTAAMIRLGMERSKRLYLRNRTVIPLT